MDLTSVLGTILGGGKSQTTSSNGGGMDLSSVINAVTQATNGQRTSAGTGGIDLSSIIKGITQSANGQSTATSAGTNGFDITSILKQLGGKNGSNISSTLIAILMQKMMAGKTAAQTAQADTSTGNAPLNGMNTSDIAGAAQNAAVILKSIFGNKG